MAHLSGNIAYPLGINAYLIGSNICNAFVVGEMGSDTDFFMIAAPPKPDSNYPVITGNFLDSEGNVIFKLVQNELIVNPGHCSKILSDRIGYEIHDSEENLILKVATRFEPLPNQRNDIWVTTIEGNFFNNQGERVVEANGADGFIETDIGCAMGFNGAGFGFDFGMPQEYIQMASIAISSHGKVFQPLSGIHENEDIHLDGKMLLPGTIIRNCRVTTETGDFHLLGQGTISNNQILLGRQAQMIALLLGAPRAPIQEDPEVNNAQDE